MSKIGSDLLGLLGEIGFSREIARVYLFILSRPEGVTPEEVSTHINLPVQSVNKVLEKLTREGFLTVTENRFFPVEPSKAVDDFLRKKERDVKNYINSLKRTVEALKNPLTSIYWEVKSGIHIEDLAEFLYDLREMEKLTAKIISNASREILILTERFDWYSKVREVLLQAIERRVQVRVLLLRLDNGNVDIVKELRNLGVSARLYGNWYYTRGTLVDDNELIFLIWATQKSGGRVTYYRPQYTRNRGLIELFREFFESKWRRATEILSS